jgi:hypothetical protein
MSLEDDNKPETTGASVPPTSSSATSSASSSSSATPKDKNRDKDKDKPKVKATTTTHRRSTTGLILLALILFAFLAGLFAWPFILPRLQAWLPGGMQVMPVADVADKADLDALSKRIDALETKLSSEPQAATEQELTNLKSEVDQQESRMQDLARRMNAAQNDSRFADLMKTHEDLAASLRDLQVRVSKLENAAPTGQQATLLALAATRLRIRAESDRPFVNDLALVTRLAKSAGGLDAAGAKALNDLGPHAEAGAPSLRDLISDFPMAARKAMKAAAIPQDAPWWQRTLDRIVALVTIRHTGVMTGDSVEARLSRAEERLDANDLSGAVTEVEAIKGRPGEKIDPWLQSAYARLAIDRAARELEGSAYRLGANTGPAPSAPSAPSALPPSGNASGTQG